MLVIQTRVFPEIPPQPHGGGGFTPTSFDHLLHHDVALPGLDTTWTHTLVDAHVAEDRASALLTVHSRPRAVTSLDRSLRIVTWQPAAYVRAHDQAGDVLTEVRQDAPLQPGQVVELGAKTYRVAPAKDHELWPHRHPDTGVCRGDIDWQHVTLVPEDPPAHLPRLTRDAQ